ncbi:hypothetical protein PQX77_010849 [Marasmius sp. AFHP31]|nr:hypothetical protein PQX77_010849 [Marasmius sp. AFHP31]
MSMRLWHFEWAFGLECYGFPFRSDMNRVSVSKDIKQYVARRSLIFVPTPDVLERALEMMDYNNTASRKTEERQRFEAFGLGPWEYTIMPAHRQWKSFKPSYLPPLYHHTPDGTVVPLDFDSYEYEDLPRFTAMVHPLVVVLFLKMSPPDIHGHPPTIQEGVITHLVKIIANWPCWIHNRFVPPPLFPKRKRNDSDSIPCYCPLCFAEPSESSSITPESEYSSSVHSDILPAHDAPDLYSTNADMVTSWQGQLEDVGVHRLHGGDNLIVEYARESVESPEDVLRRLKEEDGKRWSLATSVIDANRTKRKK